MERHIKLDFFLIYFENKFYPLYDIYLNQWDEIVFRVPRSTSCLFVWSFFEVSSDILFDLPLKKSDFKGNTNDFIEGFLFPELQVSVSTILLTLWNHIFNILSICYFFLCSEYFWHNKHLELKWFFVNTFQFNIVNWNRLLFTQHLS